SEGSARALAPSPREARAVEPAAPRPVLAGDHRRAHGRRQARRGARQPAGRVDVRRRVRRSAAAPAGAEGGADVVAAREAAARRSLAMPVGTIIQAVNDALRIEMRRDSRVVVLGEDVGKFGGVFRATTGLYDEFGPDRVFDTPLAEAGIIGSAIGMALYGLRPGPGIPFAHFLYPADDPIVDQPAQFPYRSGGQYPWPVVIRTPYGGGIRGGHYHSQSPEAYFAHTPGLKVVIPSNPYDAKGLLLSAMRGEDPVIFMEPKRVYRAAKGEVPEGDSPVPSGQAKVVRAGSQLTVLCYGAMVHTCVEAAEKAAAEGFDPEIIDLRTLMPLDTETVLESVRKTGRVVIAHEAPKTCGYGAELAALIAEQALLSLEAPIARVTGFDTPFPYTLENEYLPSPDRIALAIKQTATF